MKIEVSYRRTTIDFNTETVYINNILVYNIESLFRMKVSAFLNRDKIRDLFDVIFIYMHYKNYINIEHLYTLRDAFAYKGIDQFDYLISQQSDELIDSNTLLENFLTVYYDMGLK